VIQKPVLAADEARILLDSIDTSSVMGLRDRALIALRPTHLRAWELPLQ
jgi:site-specific recombinase XerD